MNHVVHAIGWCVEALLRPLDALAPWLSLAIVGALTAVVMLVVIRRTSPQRRIRHARAQMASTIFEMRLYLDHPLQLLRAQGRLVRWSVVYVALLLPSMLVLAAPLGLLLVHLEIRHGVAPLPPSATAVVRVEVAPEVATRDVEVETSDGLDVSAQVHADDEHAVYVRVHVRRPGTHTLTVYAGDEQAKTKVVADATAPLVSPERSHGIAQLWAFGADTPIATDAIRSISIPYPDRPPYFALPGWVSWIGITTVPWWLYWLVVATVFALLLRNRFGVAL